MIYVCGAFSKCFINEEVEEGSELFQEFTSMSKSIRHKSVWMIKSVRYKSVYDRKVENQLL